MSTKTPILSAFKRVKGLLSYAEKRQMQSEYAKQSRTRNHAPVVPSREDEKTEEVVVKATGKAIDKALRLALFLQGQNDLAVVIRTGSATAVDDISVDELVDGTELGALPESQLRRTSVLEIGVTLKD